MSDSNGSWKLNMVTFVLKWGLEFWLKKVRCLERSDNVCREIFMRSSRILFSVLNLNYATAKLSH